ncbi:unnamed protein product [Lepeophtheirus salmonis]|uniref:(salmon louse) hypothetical protein n=1 Tax=Lepeophtheirus salmonis TaxID=72036 RepID=A0A7R8H1J1_LEPSM|nr:unnamed protein product [Lepeophtheirus salmonis]CAF2808267.1 unnamed protein product [Lepeophtheirus salmonis]
MILVHCVIHRENLVGKNISPPLNEERRSVIKCTNAIKANAKCERLFKQFCENEDYVRLLLHTHGRWHSKGNCLKRFMVVYDILSVILSDKPEMNDLLTVDAECGFSAVNDLLLKKRNQLDITKRGELRIKLTKLDPDIKSLCRRQDAQGYQQPTSLSGLNFYFLLVQ